MNLARCAQPASVRANGGSALTFMSGNWQVSDFASLRGLASGMRANTLGADDVTGRAGASVPACTVGGE